MGPGAGIKLATPGSAVRLATDCAMGPGIKSVTPKYVITVSIWIKKLSIFVNMPPFDFRYNLEVELNSQPRCSSLNLDSRLTQ